MEGEVEVTRFSLNSRWISPAWVYLHGITTSTKQPMKRYTGLIIYSITL